VKRFLNLKAEPTSKNKNKQTKKVQKIHTKNNNNKRKTKQQQKNN